MNVTKKMTMKIATPKGAVASATPHPRPYLSWSQLALWERNPSEYIGKYILGDQHLTSPAMEFGSYVHAALEHDNDFDDPVLEHLLMVFPQFEHREYQISAMAGTVPVFGKLDGYETKAEIINECKTGRKWSQQRVDKDDQLTFYNMLHYCKFGHIAKGIKLYWLPTQNIEGEVSPAGMVQVFSTTRTLVSVLHMADRVSKAWQQIGEATEAEYKRLGLN